MHVPIRSVTAVAFLLGSLSTTLAQLYAIEAKLQPASRSEAAAEDHFGASTAMSDGRLAVGVPNASATEYREGHVDIYRQEDGVWVRESRLVPADPRLRNFGTQVAMDGDVLAVHAYRQNDSDDFGGSVAIIFERSGEAWHEVYRFNPVPPDAPPYDFEVTLAARGDRVIVGFPWIDTPDALFVGQVYVLSRATGSWVLEEQIDSPEPAENAGFGSAVGLDGDRLVISAIGARNQYGEWGGAAYVFEWNGEWRYSARLVPAQAVRCGEFGRAVAIHGDWIAASGGCRRPIAGDAGSVSLFHRSTLGWLPAQTIVPLDTDVVSGFGTSLALDDNTLAIPATGNWPRDPLRARVFVFERDSDQSWTRTAQIDSPVESGDFFGQSVSLEGQVLAVGAPEAYGLAGREQGAVHVVERTNDHWHATSTISRPTGELSVGDMLGKAVAIENDLMITGSGDSDVAGPFQGAIYLWDRVNDEWSERARIHAPDAQPFDGFGSAVAISGDRFVVGAPQANSLAGPDTGTAYVFVRNGADFVMEARLNPIGGAQYDRFGDAVAIDGETIVVGAHLSDRLPGEWDPRGAAYVFQFIDGAWQQTARLVASDATYGAYFGWSVAVSGPRVLVGAPQAHEPAGTTRGAAYCFEESNGVWQQELRFVATDLRGYPTYTSFGSAVGISGDTIAIGAPAVRGVNVEEGRVVIYGRGTGIWQREAVLAGSHPTRFASFGERLALRADRLAVGAGGERRDGEVDQSFGAAYLFARSGGEWIEVVHATASDGRPLQYFGKDAIAVDRNHMIVGVPYDGNGTPEQYGAVYDYAIHCAGDVNSDGVTDLDDLTQLLSHFGTPGGASISDGDLDADGDVDLQDLARLLSHFGGCPS